jgi:hypothetical protein
MKIDPNKTWQKVEARIKREKNDKVRHNLEVILEHMKAEALGDLDGLLKTISPTHTSYTAYGSTDAIYNPKSHEEVRAFYTAFIASGATRLEFDLDRLVADEDCVLTEGTMRMAYPGATLIAMGHEVDDPEAYYLYETRMAVLWPFAEDGLAMGEDSYSGWDGFVGIADRKLSESDFVPLDEEALRSR